MKAQILIAPSNGGSSGIIAANLASAGFEVLQSADGVEALRLARQVFPSALVLDMVMAGRTGLEVCRSLKADTDTAGSGIVLLTGRHQESDRIEAFEAGADDCLIKPISPRELVLRIGNILKRTTYPRGRSNILHVGDITLAFERHAVSAAGAELDLTAIEFKLLTMLMEHRHQTVSREVLLTKVWNLPGGSATRTVDTHIRRLRDKLGPAGKQIRTLRGSGYRLDGDSSSGPSRSALKE